MLDLVEYHDANCKIVAVAQGCKHSHNFITLQEPIVYADEVKTERKKSESEENDQVNDEVHEFQIEEYESKD